VRTTSLLAAALLLPALPLGAQLTDPRAGAAVRFESYSFDAVEAVNLDGIQLLTMPVSARVLLGSRFELGIAGAFARGSATRADGQERELSGLTDTEVRLTARLLDDRVRVGVVGLLPTGTTELSLEELDVAGLVASDLLPFAISHWGSGGGIGLSAAGALPVAAGTTLGLSAGYVLAREYDPLGTQQFSYRPGNQLHVRAALDHALGSTAKASLQLTYLQFGADEADGNNLYQTGDRLQALGTLAFAAGARGSAIVYAGYLRRLEGEYLDQVFGATPAQDLLYAGGSLRQPLGGVVLVPGLDLRVVGSDDGVDQGYTISGGAGVELALGRLVVAPNARLRFGRLTVRADQESNYTGFDVGVTLRNGTFVP
jgi:hypothetical protein